MRGLKTWGWHAPLLCRACSPFRQTLISRWTAALFLWSGKQKMCLLLGKMHAKKLFLWFSWQLITLESVYPSSPSITSIHSPIHPSAPWALNANNISGFMSCPVMLDLLCPAFQEPQSIAGALLPWIKAYFTAAGGSVDWLIKAPLLLWTDNLLLESCRNVLIKGMKALWINDQPASRFMSLIPNRHFMLWDFLLPKNADIRLNHFTFNSSPFLFVNYSPL